MPRWMPVVAGMVGTLLTAACGGDGDGDQTGEGSTTASVVAAPSTTATTEAPIEGVETFSVEAGHREGPLTYPQTPPVGGIHNAVWMPCAYYDQPVPNERAVHSLEHGAIWITYRPDVAPTDVEALAALARSRKHVLVSPWDQGLPSPIVATAWGRQLRLESVTDSRLMRFVTLYANQGPEVDARC